MQTSLNKDKSRNIMDNQTNYSAKIIYTVLTVMIIAAIAVPLMLSIYIYPNFIQLHISNTELEAMHTGKHLTREVIEAYKDKIIISEDVKARLENAREDYDIIKIKVFSSTGMTIYSTSEEDIGAVNKKEYFHNIVAKGNPFTKMVHKNTMSLEDQVISVDVVETYIPIFIDDKFVGAFELYYNITEYKTSLDALINRSNYIMYSLTLILIIVLLATMLRIRRDVGVRQQYESTLQKMANTDRLTGIYNRRKIEELLILEIDKYKRYKRDSSLFLLDIDHFKKVNDLYGHQAGDKVLKDVVDNCRKALRATDLIGRYGGEEFIVVLPELDHKMAIEVADRVRSAIECSSSTFEKDIINVTISIGIVHFSDMDDLSDESLIKHADKNLYTAKHNGRNQVYYSKPLRI